VPYVPGQSRCARCSRFLVDPDPKPCEDCCRGITVSPGVRGARADMPAVGTDVVRPLLPEAS
jgi:hypothetical protein